jgi:hypothetical protein
MLNKLSNEEKFTKNGALQRKIWRSEIGLAARVFRKNPSSKVDDKPNVGAPPLTPGGTWSVRLTPSSVWPPVSFVVTVIIFVILIKFLIIFMVIKNKK